MIANSTQYDTIIIGAGSAGAILAARLSEDPGHTVLLLDAGPDYPDIASTPVEVKQGYSVPHGVRPFANHDWGYEGRASSKSASLHIPRGKIIGGSSAVNGMVFLRGEPDDFDAWASAGNSAWSFNQVLPYFKKLERDLDFDDEHHGKDGPTPVRRFSRDEWSPDQVAYYDACRAMGFPDCPDHNRPYTTGVGPMPLNCVGGIRQSTAITYLLPARDRANLTIQSDTYVQQIRFVGQRAVGVDVEHVGAGETKSIDGSQILLCAGALGSPQLLMLSGIGPADHLQTLGIPVISNLPGVGQNLRDHPAVNMRWRLADDQTWQNDSPNHQIGFRYTADGSDLVNDMIIYLGANSHERFLFMRPTINLAASHGTLQLQSTNPSHKPILDYRYFSDPVDLKRQREAVRFCIELAHTAEFEPLIKSIIQPNVENLSSDKALETWILEAADTGHHSAGTCKMGPETDPLAVVNQWGSVYGVDNLRVIDASIMPDCVRANINAAVLMIGERMADVLRHAD